MLIKQTRLNCANSTTVLTAGGRLVGLNTHMQWHLKLQPPSTLQMILYIHWQCDGMCIFVLVHWKWRQQR